MKLLLLLLLLINYSVFNMDLTRQTPIEKSIFLKGELGVKHFYLPNELIFDTGKLYKLIIKNESDSKHYFGSVMFSKSIFTRKIQLIKNSKKVAEVKGIINEIELWPNETLEWWFVPIKTGIFKDLQCKVEDIESKLNHSEMGMVGTIIIK